MRGSEDTEKQRAEPASRAAGDGAADARQPEVAPSAKSRAGISRREFARRAAMASAIASLAPVQATTSAAAQSAAPASSAPASGAPKSSTPPAQAALSPNTPQVAADANLPKLSPEGQAEVDARVQSILGQYGARLSDEQKADLRRLCAWAQPPLDRLRAYHLQNGDGEALYLKPLVEREKKPPTPPSAKPAARKP